MKKRSKILFLISFLLLFIKGFSQNENYLKNEQKRIKSASQVEIEVENFITKNYKNYSLSENRQNEIIQKKELNKEIDNLDQNKKIDFYKEQELKELFFEKYPEKASLFKAIELPNELQQQCFNGGFEDGIANYTFRSSTSSTFSGCSTATNTPDFIGFVPGTDNFNARASLVTPGFDSVLQSLGVDVPRVLTGTSAIKLGNMLLDEVNDVTTMSRTLLIDEPSLNFNFSLIIQGDHENQIYDQSFFKARVLDQNNNLVDEVCFSPDSDNCNYIKLPNGNLDLKELFYTDWICGSLDVSKIVGQNATVEFIIGDCWVGKHSATVYIDDICGTSCADPLLGSIELNPVNLNCPSTPFQVCGTYSLPANSSALNGLTLSVLHEGVVVGTISTPSQLTDSTFCFLVDPSDSSLFTANPTGLGFEFEVNGFFNFTCTNPPVNSVITDLSANEWYDVSFTEGCCLPDLTSDQAFLTPNVIHEKRTDWIKTTDRIRNGVQVIYIAGEYIEMNPDFETTHYSATAQFTAYIDDCNASFVYRAGNNTDDGSNDNVDDKTDLIKNKIKLYPNPTNNYVTVDYTVGFNQVRITSMDGKTVFNQKSDISNTKQIDVSNLKNGIYTLSIVTTEGATLTEKLIKN